MGNEINEQRRINDNKDNAHIQQSELFLRSVLDILPVGVWITDKDGKILQGNRVGRQIWEGARNVGIEFILDSALPFRDRQNNIRCCSSL